ncbi:MAG: hypothetical protein JKY48_01320 [Flavobacteriales bacterium]|nr:hypothetical protein [Flavobacteriales bacterium]
MIDQETHSKIEFHYCTLDLINLKGGVSSNSRLLKDILQKFKESDRPDDLVVIDRFKNQKGFKKRKLVQISARFGKGGTRCFGRMALIKNKAPQYWSGKDVIEAVDKPANKEFIEVTNYVIDFSSDSGPIMMVEFNDSGPRVSDIEFYFRKHSQHYKIARSISTTLHLEVEFSDLDSKLENIFEVVVKVNSSKLIYNKANWFNQFRNLKTETGYKDVRVQLLYGYNKDPQGGYKKNTQGLDFARKILGWLKGDKHNIENVEDLKMTYLTEENQVPTELDFLKNKRTSCLQIPLNNGYFNRKEFETLVGYEFTHYLQNGTTNKNCDEKKQ